MKRQNLRRWAFVFLIMLWALPYCGPGTTSMDERDSAFSFMVVSKRAYESGTPMEGPYCDMANLSDASGKDWGAVLSGLDEVLIDAALTGAVDGRSFDWNTAYGAAGTLVGDNLSFIDGNEAFLVYDVTYDEASGVAIVTVELHQGNPYDPNSTPVFTVMGTAIVGEVRDFGDGKEVEVEDPCFALRYAAKDAAYQLIAAKFLDKVGPGRTPGSSQQEPESTPESSPSTGTGG